MVVCRLYFQLLDIFINVFFVKRDINDILLQKIQKY